MEETKAKDNSDSMLTNYKSTPTSNFANNMYTYVSDDDEDDDVTIFTSNKTLKKEEPEWPIM